MARRFLLEVIIYAGFAIVYFLVVLRWLADPLVDLAEANLYAYALVGLLIIAAQGVLLEWFTSLIMRRIGRRRDQ